MKLNDILNLKRKIISNLVVISFIFGCFSGLIYLEDQGVDYSVEAATIIVDSQGNGQYTSIQNAINNATVGDTIYVWAGTYNENVIVNKTVTLVGNGTSQTIINGGGSGDIIKILSKWVNITGFKIQSGYTGVYISSNNVKISNSSITIIKGENGVTGATGTDGHMGVGIYLNSTTGTNIINNTIFNINGGDGGSSTGAGKLGGTGGAGVGIYLNTSNNNTIMDNTISNINGMAGAAGGSSGGVGSNGASGGNGGPGTGIYLEISTYNTIENNTLITIKGGNGRSGTNGIDGQSYIDGGKGGSGGNGAVASGIYFQKSGNNTILNNTIDTVTGGSGGSGGKGGDGKATPPIIAASSGGDGGNGGNGALGTGMYFQISPDNTIINNSITKINGGPGGNAGNGGEWNHMGGAKGGDGGRGGNGYQSVGVYFIISPNNSLIGNIINTVDGGLRGTRGLGSSPWGVHGPNGQEGIGKGIYLYTSNNHKINNNNCSYSDEGILFDQSSNNFAISNNFSNNNNNGFKLVSCSVNSIRENKCFNNSYGIFLSYSTNIIILNSTCSNNVRGIVLYRSSNNEISSNECCSNDFGIYLDGSKDNIIKENFCNSNNEDGTLLIGGSHRNKIINNTYNLNKQSGIRVESSDVINLFNNTCLNNSYCGIELSNSDNIMISNNTCNNNYEGISLGSSDKNMIINNTCNSNSRDGIFHLYSDFNKIRANICNFNNISGINLNYSDRCTVNNNTISNNNLGLYFKTKYNINHIYHNNIISNTKQAIENGLNNIWDNSQQEGNYWSDYTGLDNGASGRIRGDGIGDTNLKHLNLDNYPFINRSGWLYPGIPILHDPGDIDSDGSYEISWKQNVRTVGYILEEDTSNAFNTPTEIYNGTDLNFQIINKPNGTYYYRLIAYGGKNDRSWSNIEDIIVDWLPDTPRNFTVVSNPNGNSLNLSWDLNLIDTKEYVLEFKSETTIDWQQFNPISHPISTNNHTGLDDGIRYDYRIQARDHRDQVSSFSEIISGIPQDIIPPAAPTGLKVTASTHNSITLEWNPNNEDDHVGYNIYRSKLSNPTNWGEPLDNITQGTEEYLDTGLIEESTYYYVITAFDEVPNESGYSNIASGTTDLGPHGPFINNSIKDFSIHEDMIDDSTIKLYDWFKDVNNDLLEFRCNGNENISVTIYQKNGTVLLIPEKDWSGQEILIFSANDSVFEISDEVKISVLPVNDAPTNAIIILPEMTYYEGKYQPAIGNATDVDIPYGDKLTFSWFSNVSGEIGVGQEINLSLPSGQHRITINVSDLEGSYCEASMEIQIFAQDDGGDGDGDGNGGTDPKLDSDNDGYPDSMDAFPNDPTQWLDSDGDNYGDNLNGTNPDYYPNDPTKWEKEDTLPTKKEPGKKDDNTWLIASAAIVVIIIAIILLFFLFIKRKKESKVEQEPQPSSEIEREIHKQVYQQLQQESTQTHHPQVQTSQQLQAQPIIQTQQPQPIQLTVQPKPQQNLCTTCNQPLTYYSQNNKYYCHNCKKYV